MPVSQRAILVKQALVKREGEEWPLFLRLKTVMAFKADPRMRAAIEKLAKKQSISMAAVIKQAIEEHLKEHGIDWREEEGER